ncbi:unnamed protein product [Ilex paraguariensis]|uniref:Carboxypeptidase n=1 Tax=Ilex paraguariensis TaxID=185542 RepID=A0ABC8SB91_9AQUA
MENFAFLCFFLLCLVASVHCYVGQRFTSIAQVITEELSKERLSDTFPAVSGGFDTFSDSLPVYIGPQDGLKESDKIETLPGQPNGINFGQYSGYVTVDPNAGRALFYYFVESPENSSTKPLVLWLNGGPGCSSLGAGAMMELGPFRVDKGGNTLYRNEYAWNNEANVIFLESPAGVGFSYSNTTSDYNLSGDNRTASDSYTFLVNWLERFPEYKTRDFFITGESYAGHYVPQLAQLILHNNKYANQTVINLKGIAIGNAYIDSLTTVIGGVDYYWTHALTSDEIHKGIVLTCNFSLPLNISQSCEDYFNQLYDSVGNIYPYDIYAPSCNSSAASTSISAFDPCSEDYIFSYLNIPEVQKALHANVTSLPYPWETCSNQIHRWNDSPLTVLPIIRELMDSGILVWIYSGDTDGVIPVTSTRYSISKLGLSVKTAWYPWYTEGEVGGYVVEYQNLTFVTIRGSGHFVPSYQPARALTLFSSFLNGMLPPSN